MKNSSRKIIALSGVGIAVAASFGVGIWAIVAGTKSKKAPAEVSVGEIKEYDFAYTEMVDGKPVEHKIDGLKICQYETRMPDGTYDYYLDEEGIRHLVKRFFETGNYGPEIFNLKKIWIGNANFTTPQENGLYVPATGEIGLNASNDATRLWNADRSYEARLVEASKTTDWNKAYNYLFNSLYGRNRISFESQAARGEMLFQTLVHEYGHHLAYSYFSSPFHTPVFTLSTEGSTNLWNDDFLKTFRKDLNYDPNLDDPVTGTEHVNTSNKKKVVSVGQKYTSDQLWINANLVNHNWDAWDSNFDMYGFYYFNKVANFGEAQGGTIPIDRLPYEFTYSYVDSTNSLDYLYSQEELFTRKTLLSSMTADKETFNLFAENKLRTDIFEEQEKIQTNYLVDATGKSKNVALDKVPRGAKYLQDDPFVEVEDAPVKTTAARDVMENIDRQIGHANGDDISYIFTENNYKVISKSQMGSETDPASYIDNFGFGGYIGNKDLNYVVALDDKDQVVKEVAPINVTPYSLGYKSTVYGSVRTSLAGENDKYSYATKEFVNKKDVLNMRLGFATKTIDPNTNAVTYTNVTPMTSFRGQNENTYGTASTYLEHLPENLRKWTRQTGYEYVIPQATPGKNGVMFTTYHNKIEWGRA